METIAYFDASHDMPEEVIAAAGFVPYKILGNVHVSNDPADRYLPAFFCPAARSMLTEALAKTGQWAGIVIAQGCNATNRHHDVWKRHVRTPFLHWFNTPLKDDVPAVRFMKTELWRLVDALYRQFGILVNEAMLADACRESNTIKKKLQVFSGLRMEKDITNREYLEVLVKSMTLPKPEAIKEIDAAIATMKNRGPFPADKIKVLLTGSDVTYPELMEQIDEAGFRVVRDDLSIGERYFATLIPEEENPFEALARYYLSIPKPATKLGLSKRAQYLETALEQSGIRAVISQCLKFCEPYAYDAVLVNNALKEKGCRVLHVEREYTPTPDNQMATRLAAFAEME
ncbi:2-hydroxyacyl-CoA dehydratase subunit D [Desulfosudis oleivorans]|nr:2-hydroxyacyl-CoA dehydratase family protein [Desulfosudis oleivorans]